MKNKTSLLTVVAFVAVLATPALAARTVPGEVPILEPLQPAPENTKPNVSANIYNGNPLAPGEEASNPSPVQDNSPALEQVQESLPLPVAETKNSFFAWFLTALVVILVGSGIGYWIHIRNK